MNYNLISIEQIKKHEPDMVKLKVSEVSRSSRGFLYNYKKYGKDVLDMKVPDEKILWRQKRNAFIARHLPSYKKNPTKRRWLALIAWAYRPNVMHPNN